MNQEIAKHFLGKEVVIFPGDTHRKQGIVYAVSEGGVVFRVTRYTGNNDTWVVDKLHFVSFGNLTFREV